MVLFGKHEHDQCGTTSSVFLTAVSPFFNVARGDSVTLSGAGFNSNPASNIVMFQSASGTTAATVSVASLTSLTVTVPSDAVCGKITVQADNQTSAGRIVTISGTTCSLQLTGFYGNAAPGEIIVLEGAGFDTVTPSNNIVRFAATNGTVNGSVVQAGSTQLHVRVPASAIAGNVTVAAARRRRMQFHIRRRCNA